MEPASSCGAQRQGERQRVQTETQEILFKYIFFYCDGDGALVHVTQGGCGGSILGDIQKQSGHSPGQPAMTNPAGAGGWAR